MVTGFDHRVGTGRRMGTRSADSKNNPKLLSEERRRDEGRTIGVVSEWGFKKF